MQIEENFFLLQKTKAVLSSTHFYFSSVLVEVYLSESIALSIALFMMLTVSESYSLDAH